jgi:hypothetical protein
MRSNIMGLPYIYNSEKGRTDLLGLRLSTAQCRHQTKAVPPSSDTQRITTQVRIKMTMCYYT